LRGHSPPDVSTGATSWILQVVVDHRQPNHWGTTTRYSAALGESVYHEWRGRLIAAGAADVPSRPTDQAVLGVLVATFLYTLLVLRELPIGRRRRRVRARSLHLGRVPAPHRNMAHAIRASTVIANMETSPGAPSMPSTPQATLISADRAGPSVSYTTSGP